MKTMTNRRHKGKMYALLATAGLLLVLLAVCMLFMPRESHVSADTVIPGGTNFTLSNKVENDNRIGGVDSVDFTYDSNPIPFNSNGVAYAYYDRNFTISINVHSLTQNYHINYQGPSTAGNDLTTYTSVLKINNNTEISGKSYRLDIRGSGTWFLSFYSVNFSAYNAYGESVPFTQLINKVERTEKLIASYQITVQSQPVYDYCDSKQYAKIYFTGNTSATYSYNGGASTPCTSQREYTDEGYYSFTATSKFFNHDDIVTNITHYVDRTPPKLTLSNEYSNTTANVTWSVGKYESPVSATYRRNGGSAIYYDSGTVLTAEGMYTVTATDGCGNSSTVTFCIDHTSPSLTYPEYTRDPFTVSASDSLSGIDKFEIEIDGKWQQYSGQRFSENGAYTFRATDRAGNVTERTATLYRTDTFGNAASIRDGYKVNLWYTVNLPARIFTTPSGDIAGRYSFESYADALEFATLKEREYRVAEVQGGYMYVSPTNETIAQKYTDEPTLNAAIDKYARTYISDRRTSSETGRDNLYTELTSLTRNSPALPGYLSAYSSMPAYFLKRDVTWSLPDIRYIRGLPYSVTATYLGDFAAVSAQSVAIPQNVTLQTALGDSYRQGWYLITESDACGNVESYLIYSDAELPTISALIGYGNGTNEKEIDYTFTVNEPTYFTSLDFKMLNDNADEYIMLKLERGSNTYYFTQSDELPTLGGEEFGSGKYTVTVFDRSLNALTFDVYIAGNAPTWSHSSLAADRNECTITFNLSDRYCALTTLQLYKINYDGTRTVLDTDSAGTPINAMTLTYKLDVGGKYGATVTDNFLRTTELPEIFFLKGLPSGKLTGVNDGGRTNKNVSVTFDTADVCEIYSILPNSERVLFSDYSVQVGSQTTAYNITASEATSLEYLVLLYNRADRGLFVEYTFEIDAILPDLFITDVDGNSVTIDGATNRPFSLRWNETGVTVRYSTARSGITTQAYSMNTVLNTGTLYYFTVRDDVGNTLEFTVLLDNYVDYTLSGTFNTVDGVLYANKSLTLTVNEPTITYSVKCGDVEFGNGATLDIEGHYTVHVADNYGNVLDLVIELDFTPPVIKLEGAHVGESVNSAVTVTASGHTELFLSDSRGNRKSDIANGTVVSEAGTYYITARDYAGNVVTVMFGIDVDVRYSLSVPIGAVTSERVTLELLEQLDVVATLDGEQIDNVATFSAPGSYALTLTDNVGNVVELTFTVIPARSRELELKLPSGVHARSATLNGEALELASMDELTLTSSGLYAIILECPGGTYVLELEIDAVPPSATLEQTSKGYMLQAVDKDNVELALTLDGAAVNCRVGTELTDAGHYVLVVTDELGNVSTYEFTIPFRLNTGAIIAIVIGVVALVIAIVFIIRARRRPHVI